MPSPKLTQSVARMWGRLHKRVHIAISPADITLVQSTGIGSHSEKLLHRQSLKATDFASEEQVTEQLYLAVKTAGCLNSTVSISLADTLVRMWIVTPPANAASLADCKAVAALRFHTLYGEFASEWVMVADWDARQPFLVCAIRHTLLQRVLAMCTEFGLSVLRLEPHFVTIWNHYRKDIVKDAWIAILDKESLTLGAVNSGRLVALRTTTAPYEILHTRTWIDQHLQREALLLNLNPPKKLLISGIIPPNWQKNHHTQMLCQPLGLANGFIHSVSAYAEPLQKDTT